MRQTSTISANAPEHGEFTDSGSVALGCFANVHLGDVLCTSALPRLLTLYQDVKIFVMRHKHTMAVFKNNPYVCGFSRRLTISLNECATGNGHIIQRFLQAFGLPCEAIPKPEIYLSDEEKEWANCQRRRWHQDRPVCVLNSGAVTDLWNLCRINWTRIVEILARRFVVVQVALKEPHIPGAILYRGLSARRYMSLISAADCFLGGTSSGSHIAAAFDIPSAIIIWRDLQRHLRFPVSGHGFKASFLYPQHWFIAAEDITDSWVTGGGLRNLFDEVLKNRRHPRINCVGHHPRSPMGFALRSPPRVVSSNGRYVRVPTIYGDP